MQNKKIQLLFYYCFVTIQILKAGDFHVTILIEKQPLYDTFFLSTTTKEKKMHMSKKFEVLTISDDFMFGIIMRNPKYCKPFWETILNIKISRIEYPQDQKTINLSLDAKSIRLDVYVEDDSNTVYNIEHTVKTEFCNLCLHL